MSVTGKKTTLEHLQSTETENGRGRSVTTWSGTGRYIKGVLSGIKHFGSGSKDIMQANRITVVYDYELAVNERDVSDLNEKDRFRSLKTGDEFEVQQIIRPFNHTSNNFVIQLLRLK